MPNYRYRGFDASGAEREGITFAVNAQEAAKQAAALGIRVRVVQEVADSQPHPTASPAPNPAQAPTPKRPAPQGGSVQRPSRSAPPKSPVKPQANPQANRPPGPKANTPRPAPQPIQPAGRVTQIQQRSDPPTGPIQINVPTAATPTAVRTREGTDKDRMFLFSQFAVALRAGISPADFLQEVSLRTRGVFRQSLEKMAEAAREGTPMSRVMELYPDLYPIHVVALSRAGEVGGFLPDAFETIAQQAEQAYKFKRWFAWVWIVIVNAVLSIPGVVIITRAALAAWHKTDEMGGEVSQQQVVSFVAQYAWQRLLWPVGPATLGICLALYLLWRFYLGRFSRPFRHQVAISWPAFGPRARAENLAIFTWTMSKLTAAGIPHGSAWELAAASTPNDVFARKLERLGKQLGGERPISNAMLADRGLFPYDYTNVIGTAEFTGDVPGAMEQLSRLSKVEFDDAQNAAKVRGGCWGALGCIVAGAFVLGLFLYFWFVELPHEVLKGFDTP